MTENPVIKTGRPRLLKFACRVAVQAMLTLRKQFKESYEMSLMLGRPKDTLQEYECQQYMQLSEAIEILRQHGKVS